MSQDAKQELQGAKIHADHRWDLFNANALVSSLLGFTPERWHLEHKRRRVLSHGLWPQEYTWVIIHAKQNGEWRYRHVPKEKAKRLLDLNITNARLQPPRDSERLKIFMSSTPT